jgi:uncharacterized coiled-coil DUF342 family protein
MSTPTPRTSLLWEAIEQRDNIADHHDAKVLCAFARDLERELAAQQAEYRANLSALTVEFEKLRAERNGYVDELTALREAGERLAEALRGIRADCRIFYADSMDIDNHAESDADTALAAWRKANPEK